MTVVTNVSPNDRLAVVVEAKAAPQAKGGVEIPGEVAGTKGAGQIKLRLVTIVNGSPNPSALEVLENPSEEAVLALLLLVDAAGPVAHVQAVVAELPRQELAPLLAAQAPAPRRQVRPPRAGHLPPLARAHGNHALANRFRESRRIGLGGVVERVVVEVIEEGPAGGVGIVRLRRCGRWRRVGGRGSVGAEVAFQAEIGGVEEEAGVAEAGAADGELVEGERGVCGGEEVGGDGAGALGLPAEVPDEGGEFGADAGQACPVARILFQLEEDVQNDVIGQFRKHVFLFPATTHLFLFLSLSLSFA